MLDQERYDDLALMYSLFGRVSAIPALKTAFNGYVKVKHPPSRSAAR